MQVPVKELAQRLGQIPEGLERLRKSGLRQISRSNPDSRFLRSRDGWQLGYTAEIAVSEDPLIVGQRVTIVEPVLGVLKQPRGMPQFRLPGLQRVGIEFTLAAIGI
jgi:hypothetical protein